MLTFSIVVDVWLIVLFSPKPQPFASTPFASTRVLLGPLGLSGRGGWRSENSVKISFGELEYHKGFRLGFDGR